MGLVVMLMALALATAINRAVFCGIVKVLTLAFLGVTYDSHLFAAALNSW